MANRTDSAAAARVMNTTPSTTFTNAANAQNFDGRGFALLTACWSSNSSGGTLNLSRIDSLATTALSTGAGRLTTVAGSSDGNRQVLEVDWPFWRVAASTGSTSGTATVCFV